MDSVVTRDSYKDSITAEDSSMEFAVARDSPTVFTTLFRICDFNGIHLLIIFEPFHPFINCTDSERSQPIYYRKCF